MLSTDSISYRLIRSDRKTISIQIDEHANVIVRAPKRMADGQIRSFVMSKADWIGKTLAKRATQPSIPKLSDSDIRALAQKALTVIPERVRYYAPLVGVTYGRITIRNQRSRWGSCSGQGNLNFNCLLMLAPPEVLDYVVVHELCHRKEMNHSDRFWAQVERILPDYKLRRKWLKDQGGALIRAML